MKRSSVWMLRLSAWLIFILFLRRSRVVLGRQLWGFAAAQLAEKIFLRFEGPTGKLPLMAVIAHFVRTAMTAIAVNDSRVARGDPAEPKEKPKWQNQSKANTLCSRHFTLSQSQTAITASILCRAASGVAFMPASLRQPIQQIHHLKRVARFA